jgi:UDP:flavonoid glycosyltransferase YjiC (YdhE family)
MSDDAGYRSRIARMQNEAREAGGYLRAADAIQQFCRRGAGTTGVSDD